MILNLRRYGLGRVDRFGHRCDQALELDTAVHVEGLIDLAPNGARELVGDDAQERGRIIWRRVGK
jgi:hypothetical protein